MENQKRSSEANRVGKTRNPTYQEHSTLPNVPTYYEQQKASDEFRPQPFVPPLTPRPQPFVPPLTPPATRSCLETAKIYKEKFRKTFKSVLGRLINDGCCPIIIMVCSMDLTVARLVAGATKLGSDCAKEKDVGIYLFVKACLAGCFWTFYTVLCFTRSYTRARALEKNLFVEVYIYVDSLFGFAWFVVGTIWTFGNYSAMISECPLFVNDWNFHFINFALFLTALDAILLFGFLIFFLYAMCDTDED